MIQFSEALPLEDRDRRSFLLGRNQCYFDKMQERHPEHEVSATASA